MGGRAAGAAFYPMGLLRAILRGMQLTRDAQNTARTLENDDWDAVLSLQINAVEQDDGEHVHGEQRADLPTGSLPRRGGTYTSPTTLCTFGRPT